MNWEVLSFWGKKSLGDFGRNKMETQNKQDIERENKSSLAKKIGSVALKTALLPIVGHFPSEVQERILVNRKYKGEKTSRALLPYLATVISVLEEAAIGTFLLNHATLGDYTGFFGGAFVFESILRAGGWLLNATSFNYQDDSLTFGGFPSVEGYLPGKIVEHGMNLYNKFYGGRK